MPTRLDGKLFTFTQPDGSEIQLRVFGDQNYAVFETLDGFTVTKNPVTRYYELARLTQNGRALESDPGGAPGDLDGAARDLPRRLRVRPESAIAAGRESAALLGGRRCDQRRSERRLQARAMRMAAAAGGPLLAPPQRQTVGDFVGLCLLIDFSDAPKTISRDEVERFCNQRGYSGFGNNGSVRDYFEDNSLGRCRYTNVVAPYYRAKRPKSYYADRAVPYGQRAYELIDEAIKHHKSKGFDFSSLSVDSQGYVYALNVFYAGEVTNNWSEGLWPHASHLGTPASVGTRRNLFDYQITAMGAELALGTFCHENGHMLCDYPDLYDYGYESSGVGGYCLMCSAVNEKNPVQISAYLKKMAGWATNLTVPAHGERITLEAGSNHFVVFARSGREYFLVENRRRSGRDADLPDEGLAIWHVDEEGNNGYEQMSGDAHYELSLEQADGLFQLESLQAQLGDSNDLYEGSAARFSGDTVPSSHWWNGTASNLTIDQVTSAGDAMTFRCLLSDVPTSQDVVRGASTPFVAIPDNTPNGVSDGIYIAEALTIASVKVTVDIAHSWRGDLRVSLTTPWSTVIELHPQGSGGSEDDLRATFDEASLPALATARGYGTAGTWVLTVEDLATSDVGQLEKWSLELATVPGGPIDLEEFPGTLIPDNDSAGIASSLTTASPMRVGSVEVSVDISHSYIGDLEVRLLSPAGTEVVLHDNQDGSVDHLARTFTRLTTPALERFGGEVATGTWTLKVADLAPQDLGKLNSWRLRLLP